MWECEGFFFSLKKKKRCLSHTPGMGHRQPYWNHTVQNKKTVSQNFIHSNHSCITKAALLTEMLWSFQNITSLLGVGTSLWGPRRLCLYTLVSLWWPQNVSKATTRYRGHPTKEGITHPFLLMLIFEHTSSLPFPELVEQVHRCMLLNMTILKQHTYTTLNSFLLSFKECQLLGNRAC